MKKKFLFLITALLALVILVMPQCKTKSSMNVYQFSVKDTSGEEVSLNDYKGKVLLIVNTATKCGFTPQYKDLQDLYLKYHDQGFEILDFPCNQFGAQAPGSNEELASFCVLKYHTTFRTFGKIKVNGDDADPLYKYLKANSKGTLGSAIKWNFTKFLIDKNGEIIKRYPPTTNPSNITGDIETLLK